MELVEGEGRPHPASFRKEGLAVDQRDMEAGQPGQPLVNPCDRIKIRSDQIGSRVRGTGPTGKIGSRTTSTPRSRSRDTISSRFCTLVDDGVLFASE